MSTALEIKVWTFHSSGSVTRRSAPKSFSGLFYVFLCLSKGKIDLSAGVMFMMFLNTQLLSNWFNTLKVAVEDSPKQEEKFISCT